MRCGARMGYWGPMPDYTPEVLEAIQIVVDRVGGYQDGAPAGTVARELRNGFSDAELDVSNETVTALASAIEEQHATVDAASVLQGERR